MRLIAKSASSLCARAMITLGVPGSPTAAVLLGGLLIWGLQPGPLLFVEKADFVWGLIASMYLGNIVGLVVVLTCVPLFAAILRVPFAIIAPVILVICSIGAFTVHNSMFDVWLMEDAIKSPKPTLINAVIDETAGTESGRITSLNPNTKKK